MNQHLVDLADHARKLVLSKQEFEERLDKNADIRYAILSVATSLQADAKEMVASGEVEKALDLMNMVSVVLFDIQNIHFSSQAHREETSKRFKELYGRSI